jgi:plastocyanin
MNKIIISCLLFSILLFGCIDLGAPEEPEKNITPPPPKPVAKPTFSVTSPINGEVVYAADTTADVNVLLSTKDLVVKPSGTDAKTGEGHFRLSLDNGAYVSFFSKSYILQGVGIGQHTLTIELVNNDNTPYSPAIVKTVAFEVQKAAPIVYQPKEYTVEILDFSYNPSSLDLKVGDSVTWINSGAYPRSATCFINGNEMFDTNVLGPGESTTLVLDELMDCEYYSVTHMAMKGTLKVEANGTG